MLVSFDWLSEYVDLDGLTPEDLADELNRTGIEVEIIYTRDNGIEGVVIGHVLSVAPHPNADRLQICTVDVGDGQPLQIVCGAPNVRAGQLVPVARIGAKLPELTIKQSKIRGVESMGMICSANELGLPDKILREDQKDGILVLGEDARVGSDIRDYLGMNDQVIELELTPNRADCLSMIGVAYEIAAIFDRELYLPEVEIHETVEQGHPIDIVLEAEEDCPFYVAQVVDGLKIGPSPQWMQNRLISAGVRPINNIVDVTNYVMIETGQPLHAFDYTKINGGQIIVRHARPGETIVTLDGVTRAVDDETLLITDRIQPLAIAGVMGGEDSEVTEETHTVLIESALFNPTRVRRTSRKMGLRSEASHRFERGVDPERIIPALSRAVQLLQEFAQGEVASNLHIEERGDVPELEVNLRHERLTQLLGLNLDPDEVRDILERLRFSVEYEDGIYRVQVPSRRADIALEVDLIEEVARLYGYDRIPTTLPWGQQLPGGLTDQQKWWRTIRRTLRDLGMHEVINYSLISDKESKELVSLHQPAQPIRLANPISNQHQVLRVSLLPSLLKTAKYNQNHGAEELAFFELAKTYITDERRLTHLPQERWELGGLLSGRRSRGIWEQGSSDQPLFFTMKGILEVLFQRLGVEQVEYVETKCGGFHPGRTAQICVGDQVVGILGQLHPQLEKQHSLFETMLFQLDLEKLFAHRKKEITYQLINRYPAVTRDLALVADEDIASGEIEAGIKQVAAELLKSITLFDVYTGKQVGPGKKSLAYSLVYQAEDRTLTDDEVQAIHNRVIQFLESTMNCKLRQ
jgi:phenylalanyl-tRNA synthetase beta chain